MLLGKPGLLADVTGEVEVALRDKVAEPADALHLTLGFEPGNRASDGTLRVEHVALAGDVAVEGDTAAPPVASYAIRYEGMDIEKIGLVFEAPRRPGVYRVAFYSEDDVSPRGMDQLIVQEAPGLYAEPATRFRPGGFFTRLWNIALLPEQLPQSQRGLRNCHG